MTAYGPLCTEFYDLDKPQADPDAVDYYLACARAVQGKVLEPMCGSGRFLLPLLAAGIDIEGVDASPSMVQACRRHGAARQLQPVVHCQALETLALATMFAMAFVPSGSINLIEGPDALRAALGRIGQHLRPGAPLLLEVIRPDDDDGVEAQVMAPRTVACGTDRHIVYECRALRGPQPRSIVFEGLYRKFEGDMLLAREEERLTLQALEVSEWSALLSCAGFRRVRVVNATARPWLDRAGCTLIEAAREP